jgi:cytochrome c oxidase cbb3-type subunit 3
MSESTPPEEPRDSNQPTLRPHEYDGIQEYDQRLPRWWLFTLFGAIFFSVFYWSARHQADLVETNQQRVALDMQAIETARLEGMTDYDNATIWAMSRNPDFINPGLEIYTANCTACHKDSLRGLDEPGGIGPNLVDAEWIHGGNPLDLMDVVRHGVVEKGMQAWSAQLGDRRIAQVVAFILSHHEEGAPFEVVPSS